VDHPAQLSTSHPWRSAALIAATIATVELFLLIVIGFAFGAKFFSREVERAVMAPASTRAAETATSAQPTAASKSQTPPATNEPAPLLPRSETSVMVLNGNGAPGAAGAAADRVQRRGYIIAGTANAPRTNFRRSIVMYRPGREAEARRLAKDLRVKRVAPLDGIGVAALQGGHVALIVGG
jgi:LytR cell envelope-related transcriptional attenuator